MAALAGYVKRPAIYELKGETTLAHLLALGGNALGQQRKAQQNSQAEVALQAAIRAETVEGDLKRAIEAERGRAHPCLDPASAPGGVDQADRDVHVAAQVACEEVADGGERAHLLRRRRLPR